MAGSIRHRSLTSAPDSQCSFLALSSAVPAHTWSYPASNLGCAFLFCRRGDRHPIDLGRLGHTKTIISIEQDWEFLLSRARVPLTPPMHHAQVGPWARCEWSD